MPSSHTFSAIPYRMEFFGMPAKPACRRFLECLLANVSSAAFVETFPGMPSFNVSSDAYLQMFLAMPTCNFSCDALLQILSRMPACNFPMQCLFRNGSYIACIKMFLRVYSAQIRTCRHPTSILCCPSTRFWQYQYQTLCQEHALVACSKELYTTCLRTFLTLHFPQC